MARKSNKVKAGENYQLWNRANTPERNKWQVVAQQGTSEIEALIGEIMH